MNVQKTTILDRYLIFHFSKLIYSDLLIINLNISVVNICFIISVAVLLRLLTILAVL